MRGVPNTALKAKLIQRWRLLARWRSAQFLGPTATGRHPILPLGAATAGRSNLARLQTPAPLDELHCALLAWAVTHGLTLTLTFSNRAPILDIVSVEMAAAAYEASWTPIGPVAFGLSQEML